MTKAVANSKKSTKSGNETDSDVDRKVIDESDADSDLDPIEHDVAYKINMTQSAPLRALREFFTPAMINPSGTESTNIIDRQELKCYNVPDHKLAKMFKLMENCRKAGVPLMMNEKQLEYSGIMIDFDIYQDTDKNQLTNEIFHLLVQKVLEMLQRILVFEEKCVVHAGITRKPHIQYKEERSAYKDGFHLIIPSIKVRRGVKRMLINKLIEHELIEQIMADVQPASIKINNRDYRRSDFLDINSSHVSTFFVGHSTKKGQKPYQLTHVYEATVRAGTKDTIITQNNAFMRKDHINICHEFSLNYEAPDGIIKKRVYEALPKFAEEVLGHENKIKTQTAGAIRNYGEMAIGAINDAQMNEIKDLLDILNIRRADEYTAWRNVVFALASTSLSYKPLAEYFSQKSTKFNIPAFEKMWGVAQTSARKKAMSLGSIHYWAKEDNPERYKAWRQTTVYNILYDMVYDRCSEGKLEHADVALLLYKALQNKYVVDVPDGEKRPCWFEFVTIEDDHLDGELFKWRQWPDAPVSLLKYLSNQLKDLFARVAIKVNANCEDKTDDNIKYYNKVRVNFNSSVRSLKNHTFKRNVILEAENLFYKRGFYRSLDKDPLVRGVQNGVLKLTLAKEGKPLLINEFHTHPVSKFTETPYIPFNPRDEKTKKLLYTLRSLFPDDEPDSFDFTMYYLSSTIDGNPKESMFMLMVGTGANGKSFLIEFHKAAIGDKYGVKMPMEYLVSKRGFSADSATPALMQLKEASIAFYSESQQAEVLNPARMKEMTGGETMAGRRLHQDMINFKPRCHHLVTSNFGFTIDSSDYGTWRRIIYNPLKITFKNAKNHKIDPSNKYEREANDEVTDKWNEDPEMTGRYLGIMVWYHHWLYRKYGGKVMNVPHPHIRYETERYRRKQDAITAFLAQRCVKCADATEEKPLVSEVQKYIKWYALNYGSVQPAKGVSEQFMNCADLKDHIKLTARGYFLKGYRFLDQNENCAEGEEYAMKNVAELKMEDCGIRPETTDQYYDRICAEYDACNGKELFDNKPVCGVDETSIMDHNMIGGSKDFEEQVRNLQHAPPLIERKENVDYRGEYIPHGLVFKDLDEPARNTLTDSYHLDMSGILPDTGDIEMQSPSDDC